MKISVAMCTYNGEKYIQKQLDSISHQYCQPDELVICDDQSYDNTINIINDFQSKVDFPVYLYINERNLGSTKNFERAISNCNADIILLADQDDWWHLQKIEKIKEYFSKAPGIGMIFTDGNFIDDNMNMLGSSLWRNFRFTKLEQFRLKHGDAFRVLLSHSLVTGATMAFRASFRNVILPIPECWVQDGWIALLMSIISNVSMINEPLINYRIHSAQQIGGGKNRSFIAKVKGTQINTSYKTYVMQTEELKKRLLLLNNSSLIDKYLPMIEDRILHLKNREDMRYDSLLWRLSRSMQELLLLRYHKYSYGFYSFAKDFLKKT